MSLARALALLAVALVSHGTVSPASTVPARPNIVVILADDLGWTDLGCMGSGYYETPNIDRLAREGMRFTDAYVTAPNCVPSRAALLTGRQGARYGMYTVGSGARGEEQRRRLVPPENENHLPRTEVTLAEALRAAGYATGMFGKWHLGNGPGDRPADRGFEIALTRDSLREESMPDDGPRDRRAELGTIGDQALRFLEERRDRPFFLYLTYLTAHEPPQAAPELVSKYEAKAPVGGHRHPVYGAMIEELDHGVGRVLDKLDELSLVRDTLLIFSSDNGGAGGFTPSDSAPVNYTSNAPLRGGKGFLYEGGIRVPLLVRWPAAIAPGSVCREPVTLLDVFPTAMELAGATPDPERPLDGLSLLPLFRSAGRSALKRAALYWHFPGYIEDDSLLGTWRTTPVGVIRAGSWNLMEFFEDGHLELYDLAHDPGQSHDLAAAMPRRAQKLRRMLDAWRVDIKAPMPTHL